MVSGLSLVVSEPKVIDRICDSCTLPFLHSTGATEG